MTSLNTVTCKQIWIGICMKMFLLMHRFNVFEFKIWIQSKINMASFFLLFSGVISYTEYLFLLCILTSKYFGKRKNPSLQTLKFQIYCYILGFFCPLLHIPKNVSGIFISIWTCLVLQNLVLCFKWFIL